MNVAKLIADHLKTVAAITALVGRRIYEEDTPDTVNQDCLRVSLLDGGGLHNLDFAASAVQVSCFGKSVTAVKAIVVAVIAELKDARLVVDGHFLVSTYQDDRFFKDPTWYHAPITFLVKCQEG